MIEKIIEYSIRNRFVVILLALAVTVGGVYAVVNTPVDAIPDLSENQVIVFTDWMGRSPRDIEDQITYPLSVNLQGLAGVKAVRSSSEVQLLDDQRHLRRQGRFLLRPRSASWSGWRWPARFCRRAWCPTWPPTPPPWGKSSGTRSRARATTSAGSAPSRIGTSATSSTRSPAWPRWPRWAATRSNTRSTSIPTSSAATASRWASCTPPWPALIRRSAAGSSTRATPNTSSAASAGSAPWPTSSRSSCGPIQPGARRSCVSNLATVGLGTQFRRSVLEKDGSEAVGGVVMMRYGENPLAVTKAIKEKIAAPPAGPARRASASCPSTTARG